MNPVEIFVLVFLAAIVVGIVLKRLGFYEEEPESPTKGWDEHKEVRKGKYRIVRTGEMCGVPHYEDKQIGDVSIIKDCVRICEEHRLKEEVKKEMAAEYGLDRK